MSGILFRSMDRWPHPNTRDRRSRWTFKAGWTDTTNRLLREIANLNGDAVVVGLVAQGDVQRRDGMLRADVRPLHPGVEVSFNTKIDGRPQRLIYATDVCEDWQHNVRSIALGLEALRAVDRYGITRHGEQYAGFAAIGAGGPDPETGRRLVEAAGGMREALFKHHPDHGGDGAAFAHVNAYREQIERKGAPR